MLRITYIDPVFLSLGSVSVKWYGVLYVVGILTALYYSKLLDKGHAFKILEAFIPFAIFGIVLGGRLFFVLVYEPGYYAHNLGQILQIWKGGMAFHGGLFGVVVASYVYCCKYKVNLLNFGDVLAIVSPIAIFFGRIGNFINMEHWGKVSNVPWAILAPGFFYPRHPSQIYEALMEGFMIFIILILIEKRTKLRINLPGFFIALFLILYGILRMVAEIFRTPDALVDLPILPRLSIGQALSIPMLLVGLGLLLYCVYKRSRQLAR